MPTSTKLIPKKLIERSRIQRIKENTDSLPSRILFNHSLPPQQHLDKIHLLNHNQVSCKNGKLWRLLTSDLTATLHSASHTSPVTKMSFGATDSEVFVSTSDCGELFLWDLSDYSHLATAKLRSNITAVCVSEAEDEILCGMEDGSLKAFRLS